MTFTRPEIEKLIASCTSEERKWIRQNMEAVEAGRMSETELETLLTMLRDVKKTGGGLVPASQLAPPVLSFAIEPDPPLTFEVGE